MKRKLIFSAFFSIFLLCFCCVFVQAQGNIDTYKEEYDFDEIEKIAMKKRRKAVGVGNEQ